MGCIEEIAHEQGFIDADSLEKIGIELYKSGYGRYLLDRIKIEEKVV